MTDFGFNFLGNVLNIKWKHHGVFRRFALNYEQNKSFAALMKKCDELVPTKDFGLAWIDEEGDPICINSEADILLAIQGMNAQLLHIHSIQKDEAPRLSAEGNAHPGVQCDLCDAFIIGTRFKCILCADYDLCQKCESTGEHKHHAMLRIVDPNETIVPWGGRLRARPGARPMGILNNVGTQIQQVLANFGIDATVESMDIRPPADAENKDKEKTTEPQKEAPMETQNAPFNIHPSNGSDVELLEPIQNLSQEPLQPSAPKEQPHQQPPQQQQQTPPRLPEVIPAIPSIPMPSEAIPLPAPQPIPYAVPMPPAHEHFLEQMFSKFQQITDIPDSTLQMAHPILPFGAPQQPPNAPYRAPVRDLHVTATLHGPITTAQASQTVPAPVPAVDATRVGGRRPLKPVSARDWVIGDVGRQVAQREPLTDTQIKNYEQLIRMGFPVNAIDYLSNLSLDELIAMNIPTLYIKLLTDLCS